MLSKFCNPLLHKTKFIAPSSVRFLVQTTAKNARTGPGGFRTNFNEQFVSFILIFYIFFRLFVLEQLNLHCVNVY